MTEQHRNPRKYEVPTALVAGGAPYTSLDEMDYLSTLDTRLGAWCRKVLARESAKVLDEVLGSGFRHLPKGIEVEYEDEFVVIGLIREDGQTWMGDEWQNERPLLASAETVELDDYEVAYVARSLLEGASGVVLRPEIPKAFLAAGPPVEEAPAETNDALPEGAIPVAIVDPLDQNAVLELLAVAPGPEVLRRNDGSWQVDHGWVELLASLSPPKMVKLDPEMVDNVKAQVDQSTAGSEFKELGRGDWDLYQSPVTASAYLQQLQQETLVAGLTANMALVAVAGRELSPKDIKNTERLKRYWTTGPGALKIRWGTPGAWRRCHRHALKYMPPHIAAGWCTNISKRLGGHGVATHVGEKAKSVAKKAARAAKK